MEKVSTMSWGENDGVQTKTIMLGERWHDRWMKMNDLFIHTFINDIFFWAWESISANDFLLECLQLEYYFFSITNNDTRVWILLNR